ncbi:MAG: PPOX class F420-dependent oxidoreductase [Microthrixaceae bacterium]
MHDPSNLPREILAFLAERHLATLTTLRADGSIHSVAVGFTWDNEAGLARVITFAPSRKARNLLEGGRASVCQVDGGRFLSLEGPAVVTDDPASVAEGVRRYTERYRPPKERDDRVVIEIAVERVLGRA